MHQWSVAGTFIARHGGCSLELVQRYSRLTAFVFSWVLLQASKRGQVSEYIDGCLLVMCEVDSPLDKAEG
jgi:hypothetical protein